MYPSTTKLITRPLAILLALLLLAACSAPAATAAPPGEAAKTTAENTSAAPAETTTAATEAPETAGPAETTAAAEEPAAAAYRVETLKLEGGTDWGIPSPWQHASRGPGSAKMMLVFASLLEKDEEGFVPWLAESWSFTDDTYTFTLFPNTRFHDGEPLTTADIAFTIDYFREHPPIYNSLGAGDKFLIDHYEIVDERTIEITVGTSNADTLASLGNFVIIPRHIWENIDEPESHTGDEILIGSGPWLASSVDAPTGTYAFTAFEGWVNGRQAAHEIHFVPVSDAMLAFENGDIDITSLPPDLRERFADDEVYGLVDKANDFGYKLLINFEQLPDFLDRDLRVALYQALDRERIVENVFRGAGSVGSAGYVPAGSLFFADDCETYPHDPDAARAVLAPRADAVTLLAADSGDDVSVAELLKLDLEAAGMEISVLSIDSASRDARVNEGDYLFALVGNGGWGNNPPNYMRTIFSDISKNAGGNPHSMGPIGYSNEEITELAEGQLEERDFDARIAIFQDLQRLVAHEIPLLVIANRSSWSIYRRDYYDGWMKTYAYQQAEQNRLSFMDRR